MIIYTHASWTHLYTADSEHIRTVAENLSFRTVMNTNRAFLWFWRGL